MIKHNNGNRMKMLIICIGALIILKVTFTFFLIEPIDVRFAEKVTLKYEYVNKSINLQITDQNDIDVLKRICNGEVFKNEKLSEVIDGIPACGFGTAEIIFEGNGKKISLFPACDMCSSMRVNFSNRYYYIGKENRQELIAVLGKYGATFPCE